MPGQGHLDRRTGGGLAVNICGVLVHANPFRSAAVAAQLNRLAGVEVHATAAGARLVVTVEDTAESAAIDTLTVIQQLDGIIAISLVYHHFDADSECAAANV
jgi:nitrate reductase NapD